MRSLFHRAAFDTSPGSIFSFLAFQRLIG